MTGASDNLSLLPVSLDGAVRGAGGALSPASRELDLGPVLLPVWLAAGLPYIVFVEADKEG